MHEPKHDPFVKVTVYVGKRVFKVVRGVHITAKINLRGLPQGTYSIRIRATTAAGHHVTGSRTYRTCHVKRTTAASGKRKI